MGIFCLGGAHYPMESRDRDGRALIRRMKEPSSGTSEKQKAPRQMPGGFPLYVLLLLAH